MKRIMSKYGNQSWSGYFNELWGKLEIAKEYSYVFEIDKVEFEEELMQQCTEDKFKRPLAKTDFFWQMETEKGLYSLEFDRSKFRIYNSILVNGE